MALDESAVSISNITEPEGDATTSHQGTGKQFTYEKIAQFPFSKEITLSMIANKPGRSLPAHVPRCS